MSIVGIDPGKSGGIAIFDRGMAAYPFSKLSEAELFNLLRSAAPGKCYIEKVHSSPQQGVVSAFSFGYAAGTVHMAAVAAGLEVEFVTPKRWQAALRLKQIGGGFGKNDTLKKNRNKDRACEIYPDLRNITHAIADALLICHYGILENDRTSRNKERRTIR